MVENGLSLCSLPHKAFDLGAIAISDDHKVLVPAIFRGGGEWVARFLRVSGPSRGAASGRASGPCGVRVAPQGGVAGAGASVRARGRRVTALVTGYRRFPSRCDRMRRHTLTRTPENSPWLYLVWRSRRGIRAAIHPSISDSSQPTALVVSLRLEGNCPRHSRRQSVVRDSPVRAQTSRHRRKRAGERPTCAGWSDASVPSWLSRALLYIAVSDSLALPTIAPTH